MANTAIGNFNTAGDPDTTPQTYTYSLVAGAGDTDNASFTIVGDALQINASPDFETKASYDIRVRTTDQGGLFTEQTFTVNVNDLNEAPTTLTIGASDVDENVVANTAIGNFNTAGDPDTTLKPTLTRWSPVLATPTTPRSPLSVTRCRSTPLPTSRPRPATTSAFAPPTRAGCSPSRPSRLTSTI